MLKIQRKDAFSVVETIITAVVAGLVAFAIVTTMIALQTQGRDSTKYLQAAKAGYQALALLRGQLSADSWNAAPFLPGTNYEQNIDGMNVTHYTVDLPSGARAIYISVYDSWNPPGGGFKVNKGGGKK